MANAYDSDARYIDSLHWFDKHNGAKQFMVYTAFKSGDTAGALIRMFDGSNATSPPWTILKHIDGNDWDGSALGRYRAKGPWQGEQSTVWAGRLYMANGVDRVIVFDGDKTSNAGYIDTPPKMTADPVWKSLGVGARFRHAGVGEAGFSARAVSGTGPNPADDTWNVGVYRYRYTYVNERGQESAMSAPSSPVVVSVDSANARGFVSGEVPTGPAGTVARRIYRSKNLITITSGGDTGYQISADDLSYYFLDEIQDNATTDFEDGKPDSLLGSLKDPRTLGPMPSGIDYLSVFKNTMFYSSNIDNQIYFSAPLFPEVVPDGNVFECGSAKSGPCMGMIAYRNALVVFRARGIYLIKGDPARGFYSETLTEDTGCVAPNSIAEIPGVGVAFLSPDGLSVLDGALENTGSPTRVISISSPIKQYFDKINKSAVIAAVGFTYHKDKEYWLNVPTIGSQDNDLALIFHYEIGEWSIREDFPIKCAVETGDHRGYLHFGSNDSSQYGLFVYSHGFGTKGSATITPKWESVHHSAGSPYKVMQPVAVRAYAVGYGNNDLQLDYRINRDINDARSAPLSRDQQDPGDTLDVYNTATLGSSSKWGFFRPTVVSFDVTTRDLNRTREFQVAFSVADTRVQLVGYDIEVQSGEQENILPMNTFNPDGR